MQQTNSPQNNPSAPSKPQDNDLQKDKNKNPDQDRDVNKTNPDGTQLKGDNCGC